MVVKPYELLSGLDKTTRFRYLDDVINIFVAGSHLHGARIEGTSDLDYLGCYIEPPPIALGIHQETGIVIGTSDQYEKNSAEDVDTTLKTLREWSRLAAKGNPTVIAALFVPDNLRDPFLSNSVWQYVLAERNIFLCRRHIYAFLGFGESQYKRIKGVRGRGVHGQRPELEEKYGYDTKAAMHLIRMMYEGTELVTTGKITFPSPRVSDLLDIRQGKWALSTIEKRYFEYDAEMRLKMDTSPLPETVDREQISELIASLYLKHWDKKGLL